MVGDELVASAAAHIEDGAYRVVLMRGEQSRIGVFVAVRLGVVEAGDIIVVDLSGRRHGHGKLPRGSVICIRRMIVDHLRSDYNRRLPSCINLDIAPYVFETF